MGKVAIVTQFNLATLILILTGIEYSTAGDGFNEILVGSSQHPLKRGVIGGRRLYFNSNDLPPSKEKQINLVASSIAEIKQVGSLALIETMLQGFHHNEILKQSPAHFVALQHPRAFYIEQMTRKTGIAKI